jgi:hypothetical protein
MKPKSPSRHYALLYGEVELGEIVQRDADFPNCSGTWTLSLDSGHPEIRSRVRAYIKYSERAESLMTPDGRSTPASDAYMREREPEFLDLIESTAWALRDESGVRHPLLVPVFFGGDQIGWRWNFGRALTGAKPAELWSAYRAFPQVRETAEAWITKREDDWTADHERLAVLVHSVPDQALATMFGIMQLTDDQQILGSLAAGPLEEFLGVHGKAYLDTFHTLALEHRRLREVLNGVWQGAMTKEVWHRIEMLQQRAFS